MRRCSCGREARPAGIYCGDECKWEAKKARLRERRRVANGYLRCCLCDRVGGKHWDWCKRSGVGVGAGQS
jgi:hypothetical protein